MFNNSIICVIRGIIVLKKLITVLTHLLNIRGKNLINRFKDMNAYAKTYFIS